MDSLAVIVLAAGLGKRMGSNIPKVLHKTIEKTLIEHVLENASSLNPERIVVVTGFEREKVEEQVTAALNAGAFGNTTVSFAWQKTQLGTGDAVKYAVPQLDGFTGTVVILYGDVPLLRPETLVSLLIKHQKEKASLTLMSAISDEQRAYGRVIRDKNTRRILRVTEARDCNAEELLIREVNSGIYAVHSTLLPLALESLNNNNAQAEYYLTDIVEFAVLHDFSVSSLTLYETEELQGVNNLLELSFINSTIMKRRRERLITSGVFLVDPASFFVDPEVVVEPGASIGPNVQIRGKSVIKSGVVIEGTSYIADSTIEEGVRIKIGVRIEGSTVRRNASVGPFSQLRPESIIGEEAKIGNFVEIKKSTIEAKVNACHLSYIGDAFVGQNSNIGAGTITCNYDGKEKHRTTIEKNTFIGSDTVLVAPVTVKEGAYVGAASVITKEVPKDSLALTRPPLVIKEGWAAIKRKITE